MMIRNWADFKYEIANFFFDVELDEAYKQGIGIGAEYATHTLSFRVRLKQHLKLTKTEERGYDKAIEVIERVKSEIAITTGTTL